MATRDQAFVQIQQRLRKISMSRRQRNWLGPVAIAKLPASIARLCDAGKVSAILHSATIGPHLGLVIRGSHHREIGREWIDAQIIAPFQLDLFDCSRNLLKSGHSLCPTCKSNLAVDGHEKRR